VQFKKLRVSGFKSFVDATELWIEPGTTGIVGPNGCGKSNLVDALRWAMGETSARQMRGGEMDDVIFAGTATRPARNIAEVSLFLDNARRKAPAPFNEAEEIEVTRRIDRGSGSTYHVNGKEVRARDVHVLFADAATGARSTGLVSQGHISDIIKAKPADRRMILEEAAGITGLHSRRHEAELRLRAAETNLTRLDDVLVTLEAQLVGLKRQARQASRYRRIGDLIRRAEAALLHRRWQQATATIEAARARFAQIESEVAALTMRAAKSATAQADAASKLPDLRRAEAEAGSRLQRLVIEREGLEAEEARIEQARREIQSRIAESEGDTARENGRAADAETALARIGEEESAIAAQQANEASALETAVRELAEASREVSGLESDMAAATQRVAGEEARRDALAQRASECAARLARLKERAEVLARDTAALQSEAVPAAELAGAESALQAAKDALEASRSDLAAAESAVFEAQSAENTARDVMREAEAAHARLDAEGAALSRLLGEGDENLPPVIDRVTVEPGFELALAAALGDDLGAPVHDSAPVRWEELGPMSGFELPHGAEPLSNFVTAPTALARRLAQIGVVETESQARMMRAQLKQGQRLVTREGALWRWDGFTAASGHGAGAAERLDQRNRLKHVMKMLPEVAEKLAELRARFEAAQSETQNASAALRTRQEAARAAESALESARVRHAELAQKQSAIESKLAALADAAARAESERGEAEAESAQVAAETQNLPDPAQGRAALAEVHRVLSEKRAALAQCQTRHDRLAHEAEARSLRLTALAAERASWQSRAEEAAKMLAALAERLAAARTESEQLAKRPAEIAAARNRLLDEIAAGEHARNEAAHALAAAEAAATEADKQLKEAEQALGQAREERVRAEALVEQAEQARNSVAERITERLGCEPHEALAAAGIAEDEELPELAVVEGKLERLTRERDNMGPVNLRAETESAEVETQIETMKTERADLVSAIARLRQGIASLNREGRERLLAAFAVVDKHFQELFVRLFGGGRAYMKLTEAEDPLEAGLEIFASPPGKRLQNLTLLSGGEQALTALALLFAVFLTNPAPICVLDEVDAPLDDANVDRFCTLIDDIARASETRFLVVTHHRITMSRVQRLFGVTMAERGISQLVSVDLGDAERLRATA
jgi:chromosome segregation protein